MLGGSRGATLLRLGVRDAAQVEGFGNGAQSVPAYMRQDVSGVSSGRLTGPFDALLPLPFPFSVSGTALCCSAVSDGASTCPGRSLCEDLSVHHQLHCD